MGAPRCLWAMCLVAALGLSGGACIEQACVDCDDDDTPADDDDSTSADDDSGDDDTADCVDEDGDGYGAGGAAACDLAGVDCDDSDGEVNPGAEEVCNELDDDCDGEADEGFDADEDGIADCVDDCPVYADANVVPGGGGTYYDPCASIADAIDLLPPGCLSIRLFPANFGENVDFGGLDLDIASLQGPEVTIIEPPAGGTVVTIATNETAAASLEGVTLRGGTGTSGHPGTEEGLLYGGGLFIYDASPTIRGYVIEDNEVDEGYGGGGYMHGYDGLFANNRVRDNTALKDDSDPGGGGGLAMDECTATVFGNVFEGNSSLGESADGFPEWWQPGPYDTASYPAQGWDCDDDDPEVFPGVGC